MPRKKDENFRILPDGSGTVCVLLRFGAGKNDPNVVVPAEWEGKRVTALDLTDGGEYLSGSIVSLHIPASVERITGMEEDHFKTDGSGQLQLRQVTVDAGNPFFRSDGKALYSADGRRLLHIFAYDLTEYRVADGTVEICDHAFAGQQRLEKIILPPTVTSIGSFVFYRCSALKEIIGADRVEEVGENAFDSTPYFRSMPVAVIGNVYIRDRRTGAEEAVVPEGIREVGGYAFVSLAETLRRISFPSTLEKFGLGTFLPKLERFDVAPGCRDFVSRDGILYTADLRTLLKVPEAYPKSRIVLPESVERIATRAFFNCRTIREVIVPKSLKTIEISAFSGCQALERIDLSNVEEIGDLAFYDCRSLPMAVLSCRRIGWECFCGCTSMKNVKLTDTETIDASAFMNCGLGSILLPETLTWIGESAFRDNRLSVVRLPKSVRHAEPYAFGGAGRLEIFDTLDLNPVELCFPYSRSDSMRANVITVLSAQSGELLYDVPVAPDAAPDFFRELEKAWGRHASFDFRVIDEWFPRLQLGSVKQRAALYRLKYPVALSPENEKLYSDYVKEHSAAIIRSFIENADLESFLFFESFLSIEASFIDELIDLAAARQAVDFTAFLMEYKERNFGFDLWMDI